jgi:hypothetical protein
MHHPIKEMNYNSFSVMIAVYIVLMKISNNNHIKTFSGNYSDSSVKLSGTGKNPGCCLIFYKD